MKKATEPKYTLEEMKHEIARLADGPNYKTFIKALFSYERCCDDEELLERAYHEYMSNDDVYLLHDRICEILDEDGYDDEED